MTNHHKHLSSLRIQRGQAMIEYAILLLLLVMIFVGGAEIGSTALASYKTTDAAKAAISEYAEINQQRLNILNAEKQYLTTLAGYGCDLIEVESASTPAGKFKCPSSSNQYDTFQAYLDDVFDESVSLNVRVTGGSSTGLSPDDVANFIFSDAGYTKTTTTITNPAELPSSIILDLDLDSNAELDTGELILGEELLKDSGFSNLVSVDKLQEGKIKYTALLLIEHIKLSRLPLDTTVKLSEAKISLGNHGAVASSAVCNPDGSYDYNIDNQQYFYRKYKDSNGDEQVYQVGSVVYLFQPFAIDVQSCEGVDPNRGNQSRLSVLVNGYSRPSSEISPTDPEDDFADASQGFVPGLPKLNQAMYSLYTKVCLNASNVYISCKDFANVSRTLLKPPGKLCFQEGGLNEDNCPNNPNQSEVSGFYMWGRSSASKEGYEIDNVANELATGFRPTFQLDCSPQPNLKGEVGTEFGVIHDTACDSNPSKVRVHTRYRKVFEGFVTLGLMELASTANGELGLFYNPNNVGVSNQVNSVAGSEIGPLGANQRPTVKYFRDFRGCYEVDVETNQVSACN